MLPFVTQVARGVIQDQRVPSDHDAGASSRLRVVMLIAGSTFLQETLRPSRPRGLVHSLLAGLRLAHRDRVIIGAL